MQVCTSLQTDNHASTPPLSFLQAGCPSCRPTNSVKALKAQRNGKTPNENPKEMGLDWTGLDWKDAKSVAGNRTRRRTLVDPV